MSEAEKRRQQQRQQRQKLRKLGDRRRAARAELEKVRDAVYAEIEPSRDLGITWKDLANDTDYTPNRLQVMQKKGPGGED